MLHTCRVTIQEDQLQDFRKTMAKLNAKAQRFGLPAITASDPEHQLVRYAKSEDGQFRRIKSSEELQEPAYGLMFYHFDLTFPIIKLGKWHVVAQLENTDAGNLVFSMTRDPADVAAIEAYRDHPASCDHCNVSRKRKLCYVLKSDEGLRQVGSTCVEDFTGVDPSVVLFLADIKGTVESFVDSADNDSFGPRNPNRLITRDYLAGVSFCISQWGWVPSSSEFKEPTYQSAWALPSELRGNASLRKLYRETLRGHLEFADQVISWATSQDTAGDPFGQNVKILLSSESIGNDRKHFAFAAGAVAAYQRKLRKDAELKSLGQSAHVGELGDKRTTELTFLSRYSYDSAFGLKNICVFRDDSGNKYVWRTTSAPSEIANAKAGERFEGKFKIKGHSDYQGVAQTEISHLKILKLIPAEEVDAAKEEAAEMTRENAEEVEAPGMRP